MSWQGLLAEVAPFIAGAIGTPAAGLAVKAGLDFFGIKQDGENDEEKLKKAIETATPEQLVELQKVDNSFKIKMRKLGLDEKKLERMKVKDFIDDTANARHENAGDDKVFWLGVSVIIAFFCIVVIVLYGCYQILTGSVIIDNAGVFATATGIVGSLIGYMAANAQQVISFNYGSSIGSKQKTKALSDSVSKMKL